MLANKRWVVAAAVLLSLCASPFAWSQGQGGGAGVPQGVAAGQNFRDRPGWFVQAGRNRLNPAVLAGAGSPDVDSLSEQETHYLAFMRVEEMLARNVYLTLGGEWGLQVFASIAESEQRHMDAMKGLLNRYRLDDPVTVEMEVAEDLFPDEPEVAPGVTFGDLYAALVLQGTTADPSHTQLDPLGVGAWIEERDMLDIWNAIDAADNEDIIATYESLLCGSRNHLRAFVYQLEEIYGAGDYVAQIDISAEPLVPDEIADQAAWDEFIGNIIDSETERCGRRARVSE